MFWHYPHYSNQGSKPGSAIREGNYKLIYNYEDSTVELYNVIKDIGEKTNIAATHVQMVKSLKSKLFQWLKNNNALMPIKNPKYNPTAVSKTKNQEE